MARPDRLLHALRRRARAARRGGRPLRHHERGGRDRHAIPRVGRAAARFAKDATAEYELQDCRENKHFRILKLIRVPLTKRVLGQAGWWARPPREIISSAFLNSRREARREKNWTTRQVHPTLH